MRAAGREVPVELDRDEHVPVQQGDLHVKAPLGFPSLPYATRLAHPAGGKQQRVRCSRRGSDAFFLEILKFPLAGPRNAAGHLTLGITPVR